uniref:Uncharacterized protein n=2 Tax=Avena sativa TaxID=4498 RepID=A0ACD5V332_AVESA
MEFDWAPVYETARPSIFSVTLIPSNESRAELTSLAMRIAGTVGGLTQDQRDNKIDYALRTMKCVTGFSVGAVVQGQGIAILTCAHGLSEFFKGTDPITPEQINRLFTVRVTCRHNENGFYAAGGDLMNGRRNFTLGRVARIDYSRDLMLVVINRAHLRMHGGAVCNEDHPSMLICPGDPDPATSECLMVSCPRLKADLMSLGRISTRRTTAQLNTVNAVGFNFEILEVQMVGGHGSSGAPLINREGQVIGLLHGGDSSHSYFVGVQHLRAFLLQQGPH